ncbi:hypothetical protein [Streptomyces sp. H27-D2]|uniref:hypothetical protein n=1 Tax=Streptomyces sp. H27-D2 TaxID=3046304 RepID=UPI003FA72A39
MWINDTTLASWVSRVKRAGGDGTLSVPEREELARLRQENTLPRDHRHAETAADRTYNAVGGVTRRLPGYEP